MLIRLSSTFFALRAVISTAAPPAVSIRSGVRDEAGDGLAVEFAQLAGMNVAQREIDERVAIQIDGEGVGGAEHDLSEARHDHPVVAHVRGDERHQTAFRAVMVPALRMPAPGRPG